MEFLFDENHLLTQLKNFSWCNLCCASEKREWCQVQSNVYVKSESFAFYLFVYNNRFRKKNKYSNDKFESPWQVIQNSRYFLLNNRIVHKENEGQKFWDAFVLCIWIDLFAETFKYWYCITDWISDDSSNSILFYDKTSYVNVPQICN